MNTSTKISGFYIAHHRWLDNEYGQGLLYKVGHTGDLCARLTDDAYTTCFPPGWRYVATFEVKTKNEAYLLESSVLYCCHRRRIGQRELVNADVQELKKLACSAAKSLGIDGTLKENPIYKFKPRSRKIDPDSLPDGQKGGPQLTPLFDMDQQSKIEHLVLSSINHDFDDFINDLLGDKIIQPIVVKKPSKKTLQGNKLLPD